MQEWGRGGGAEIVLVHGGMGSHHAWGPLLSARALVDARLVSYDLRGHGDSDKPVERAFYDDGARWADELHSVFDALSLRRVVLVCWSLGGVVATAYLRKYGTSRLAGAVWVGAIPELPAEAPPAVTDVFPLLSSPHGAERIDGLRVWLRSCFAGEPPRDTFERMLAGAACALPSAHLVTPPSDPAAWEILAAFDRPALVVHGAEDRIVPAATGQRVARTVPGATLSVYEGVGHAPFIEDPERFGSDLATFAR